MNLEELEKEEKVLKEFMEMNRKNALDLRDRLEKIDNKIASLWEQSDKNKGTIHAMKDNELKTIFYEQGEMKKALEDVHDLGMNQFALYVRAYQETGKVPMGMRHPLVRFFFGDSSLSKSIANQRPRTGPKEVTFIGSSLRDLNIGSIWDPARVPFPREMEVIRIARFSKTVSRNNQDREKV